ncbi:MAG: hypothetical protein PHN30_07340 [Bacteroidales bacterium]|jgi:hypothetical protein|nr:hypothetical protein [Bacteroidales bacterium]MDD3385513.1 hypothetical protein [Bacteroidales bacterium]MDD3870992.1 hypothetical protein [Bacteroidales bacterium]MDD4811957.1 hypothetical protein [Bacteroidales bacterium]
MLKRKVLVLLVIFLSIGVSSLIAQEETKTPKKIYNPQADAKKEITAAIQEAIAVNPPTKIKK